PVSPRPHPSFPTRRSSDLAAVGSAVTAAQRPADETAQEEQSEEGRGADRDDQRDRPVGGALDLHLDRVAERPAAGRGERGDHGEDRKSTRLNSSHGSISYA